MTKEINDDCILQSETENSESYNPIQLSPDFFESPVVKIDSNGKILYANRASFELLNEWLTTSNDCLPDYFLKGNPGILNPNADFSVPFNTGTRNMNFDVIGFKESGYIGLYAIMKKSVRSNNC